MANTVVKQKSPLWEPQDIDRTNVAQFINHVNKKYSLQLKTYEDLHTWSVGTDSLQSFWKEVYLWLELSPPGASEVGRVFEEGRCSSVEMFPPPKFFPNESLNLAEILLRRGQDNEVAVHFVREGVAGIEHITWGDLRERTRRTRSAIIKSGVVAGDVVAAIISNSVDAIVLALAALSIGAIWSSSSNDMGVAGIVDRYSQVDPKLVFADDGYIYAGKTINLEKRIADWSHKLGSSCNKLSDIVVIPYCNLKPDLSNIHHGRTLNDFLARDSGEKLSFELVPFSHPAFILYSSGTTGRPKCIVHSTGGVAIKVKTDLTLQNDVRRSDVVFQYTTASWVMWVVNFVNLSCGKSMLLYDGSPFHPTPTVLLSLAEQVGVGVFGVSPRYLSELKSRDILPRKQFDLSKLRIVTSTGSALSPELYQWFYSTAFPPRLHLISMSGGTDIAGCFVGGTPLLPIYSGEIQAKALGMAIDILDVARTEPVSIETTETPGELVCTKAFPSQPLTFIGEGGWEKYKSSYFERFGTSTWCQGDFIQRLKHSGGFVILGRSDGVLNPSGVRFGSAEIYAVTETIPEIADSICVGQKRERDPDERVLLFVIMKPGSSFTPDLEKRIRTAIRERYSPRHVPRFIFEVADIPYTVNGKKCEINVKHLACCRQVALSGTVANPEALKLYEKYQNLPVNEEKPRSRTTKL